MAAEVTVEYWEPCRPIHICPTCHGDTGSHALGCTFSYREQPDAKRVFCAGLRPHELEVMQFFTVLGASAEPDHFWLSCYRRSCGTLFHVRKPPTFDIVHVFEREKPIASDKPIHVRPEGLCVGDWVSLATHRHTHEKEEFRR